MSETSSTHNSSAASRAPGIAAEKIAQTRAPVGPKKGPGVGYALFTIAVLAGIGAAGYFFWYGWQKSQQQIGVEAASTRQQLDALAHRTEQLEQQIGEALPGIRTLQTQQQALEDSLAQLRSEAVGGSRAWDLEEIAALLQIANDRLHLEKEVAPSLAALEAADRHLRDLKNPALLEVRRHLAEEITALRSTADPDIAGMALTLGSLIQGIDRLPIANASFTEQPKSGTGSEQQGWRGVLHDLWEKIKSLVVIRRHGGADRPLLAPEERYFLRQNLRLNLEEARNALLLRDGATFQQTLRSAAEWIALYFDSDAPATAGALQQLTNLRQIDIAPSLPDISGSLNALQTWLDRQRQQKNPNAPRATHP